jgi:HEAT repeat protein
MLLAFALFADPLPAAEPDAKETARIRRLLEYSGLNGTTEELYAKFTSADAAVRKSLLMDAAYTRPNRNIELMRQFVLDPDDGIAARAAAILSQYAGPDDSTGRHLIERAAAMPPYNPEFDSLARSALHFSDPSASYFISAVAAAANPETKLGILGAAARSDKPECLVLLLGIIGDKDARVAEAAYAGAMRMLEISESGENRAAAAFAGRSRVPLEELAVKLAGSSNPKSRAAAIKTLGALGGTRAVAAVKEALEKFSDSSTAAAAAGAARMLRAPALAEILAKQLGNSAAPRMEILAALREIPSSSSWRPVRALLANASGELRGECVYTLASLDGKKALAEILPGEFGSSDEYSRRAALSAAAVILKKELPLRAEHIDKFLAMLGSEDATLRDSAAGALIALDDQRVVTPLMKNIESGGLASLSSVMPLAAIAGPKCAPYLETIATFANPLLKIRAAQALCFLGNASRLVASYPADLPEGYMHLPSALEELFGLPGLNHHIDNSTIKNLALARKFVTTGATDEPLETVLKRYLANTGVLYDAGFGVVFLGSAADIAAYRAWRPPERMAGSPADDVAAITKLEETHVTVLEKDAAIADALKSIAESADVEIEFETGWDARAGADMGRVTLSMLLVRPVDAFRAVCAARNISLEVHGGKLIVRAQDRPK